MEGVICLSIRFIPTVLVSNTLHILPQSLVSMERKVGARRDTSKESGEGGFGHCCHARGLRSAIQTHKCIIVAPSIAGQKQNYLFIYPLPC